MHEVGGLYEAVKVSIPRIRCVQPGKPRSIRPSSSSKALDIVHRRQDPLLAD